MNRSAIVDGLRTQDRLLAELDRRAAALRPVDLYNKAAAWVHETTAIVLGAEAAGMAREVIRATMPTAWAIHGRAAWIRRLQTWPRGYPGDFETIEELMDGGTARSWADLPACLNYHALISPAAQQHRNKIAAQASLIAGYAHTGRGILSIACGGSLDFVRAGALVTEKTSRVVLNDIDADALALSESRIRACGFDVEVVPGNIVRRIAEMKSRRFGLILAGGLFDYLTERLVERIVRSAWALLEPGGTLFFTNILPDNPNRPWIEALSEWVLIERSERDIIEVVTSAGIPAEAISIERDATGLTALVSIRRPS